MDHSGCAKAAGDGGCGVIRKIRALWLAVRIWSPINLLRFRFCPRWRDQADPFELISWATAWEVGKLVNQEWTAWDERMS